MGGTWLSGNPTMSLFGGLVIHRLPQGFVVAVEQFLVDEPGAAAMLKGFPAGPGLVVNWRFPARAAASVRLAPVGGWPRRRHTLLTMSFRLFQCGSG